MIFPSVLENVSNPDNRFCKKVKGPRILHICGDTGDFLKIRSEYSFDAISVEEKVSIKAAKASIKEGQSSLETFLPYKLCSSELPLP
ncbi:uroporphyrinogen decarboxylase family protein [Methanosarcina sp.]|uniref:uroporphyrinogen decarboxylase family protein n=1 Tax=Methanosarcina sp. TaxID=2213 RepID=UPI003C76CE08